MHHPQTAEEAERTLWHALDHVSGLILYRRTRANEDACGILREAIHDIVNEALNRAILRAYISQHPEGEEGFSPSALRALAEREGIEL